MTVRDEARERRRPLVMVGVAALAAVTAALLHAALYPLWAGKFPFLLFFAAIMVSAWIGGLVAGLAATLFGALINVYWWLPPAVHDRADRAGLVVYFFVGVLMSLLVEAMHAARRSAERSQTRAAEGQEAMARLAAIVQSSDDAIIAKTPEGVITTWNPAAERLFGYTAAEAVGQPITLVIPPERQADEQDVLRGLFSGETARHYETVRRRKDGTLFDVALTVSPIHDAAGRVVGASKIVRDISERARADAERARLMQAERRAREAAERAQQRAAFVAEAGSALASALDYDVTLMHVARLSVPVLADLCAIDLVQDDGTTRRVAAAHVDPAKERLVHEVRARYGFNRDAPTGVPAVIREARAVLMSSVTEADLARAAQGPEQLAMFRALDLRSWMIVPLVARERVLGALTFVITESDRRYDAADLELAQTIASRAAIAIDNAILFREADTARAAAEAASTEAEILAGLIASVSVSLELETILRKVCEAARALCLSDVATIALRDPDGEAMLFRYRVAPPEQPHHISRVEPGQGVGGLVLQTGEPVRTDDYAHDPRFTADETAHAARVGAVAELAVPVRVGPRIEGLLYVTNLSPRRFTAANETTLLRVADHAGVAIRNARLLVAEREARREAEAANRAKDQFLATMSHELRTPLNAVHGWATMLAAGQLDEATARRALATIVRNANAQVRLVDDLLDVSRITTGKMRLDVRPVDLPAVITDTLDTIRPGADAKNIRVHSVLDPRAGPVAGDPARLQQVVWNLVNNALKFTPKGGRIEVRLERVSSHVQIVVSDTGEGIPAEFLPHVFDRFRQADETPARRHGGLGIGLALVRHLVELHGGSVTAASEGEGRGATFVVKLPVMIAGMPSAPEDVPAHPAAPRMEPAWHPTESLAGLRILVVDDDVDALGVVETVLTRAGATTQRATTAAEGFALLRQSPPDVLISDIEMPREDGYSLIRKVRALAPEAGGRTPAVALTAYGRSEDRVRSLSAGFSMHVPKPVEPRELTAIVASLAGRIA